MVIEVTAVYTFVPLNPNSLAAASIFGFDLGVMVLFGGLIGLVVVLNAMIAFFIGLSIGYLNYSGVRITANLCGLMVTGGRWIVSLLTLLIVGSMIFSMA